MSAKKKLTPTSPKGVGVMVMVVLLAFSLFAFNRPRVETTLSVGEELKAEFSQAYKLVPYQSVVKLAGVEVGTVTGVERTDSNGAVVRMKLDNGTTKKLGTSPNANVRPTLVLGGTYYVELVRGGQAGSASEGSTIPVARTTVPVELDKVLSTITPTASDAVKGTVANFDKTLRKGGTAATRRLLETGPATLVPAADVLTALQGTHPADDLTRLVSGLQNTAGALTQQKGQLAAILDDLSTTTGAMADSRQPIAAAVADGPQTLKVTREGLADLDGTLDKLRTTASSFRPAARALHPVLSELDAVLKTARPVIADARVVARDARPLVQDLVPTAVNATGVLNDVKGPVLDRANGPIKQAVLTPWHGDGKYAGGGNDHPLFKELGYLLSDTADVFKFHDHNGAHGRLMAGVGVSTPGGIIGKSLEQYLEMLGFQLPVGPQEGANAGEPAPPFGSSPSSSTGPVAVPAPQDDLLSLLLPLVPRSDR